ncbi:MAG: hypothetical protein HC911_09935 [Chloroflexaceae bacterium]|nr:hypothetical protein [Chloroflexaceae bacterium]
MPELPFAVRLPRIVASPTERTTAATDVLLAVQSFAYAADLLRRARTPQVDQGKATLWAIAFANAGSGAMLGAIAHGLDMSPRTNQRIWQPLRLSLSLAVAFFVAGTLYDTVSAAAARRGLPFMLGGAVVFWRAVPVAQDSFWPFTLYQGAGMLVALGGYGRQALRTQDATALWMLAGVILSGVAGAVQATPDLHVTAIWEFDQNGLYHLIQSAGLVAIQRGVTCSLAG